MHARGFVRLTAALQATLLLGSLFLPALVFADQVVNDISVTTDTPFHLGTDMVLAEGTLTVNYKINATGGDGGPTGSGGTCNASDGSSALLTFGAPAGAHVSPLTRTYTSCNSNQSVAYTFDAPGVYAIPAPTVADSGAGSYATTGAPFTAYAFNLQSYTTGDVQSETFASGATVKGKAFALTNDFRGSLEWWKPDNTKDGLDTNFNSDLTGNTASGTHAVTDCGTWTIKLYDKSTPTAVLLDTDTFTVTGCVVDTDGDGITDASDNCPTVANADQANNDGDSFGDACDPDDDNDGVLDATDNCQFTANVGQADADSDGAGDACDTDDDNDGVADASDNCPTTANADQADLDGDGAGDACDADDDNDGVADVSDNCPLLANANQADADGDGAGDACDLNAFAPEVSTAAGDANGDEGSTLTTSGAFSDGDAGATLTVTFTGAGTGVDDGNGSWHWSFATTDDGTAEACAYVSDGDVTHDGTKDCFDWTAANVAPTIAISGNANVNEGSSYSLTLGSVTDPGDDTVTNYHVDWGDGSSDDYATNGVKTHTYADGPNNWNITVDLTDEDGTFTDTANAQAVQVDNVAPTIDISGNANVNEGSSYSLTLGSVTDPGDDTVTNYHVDWGDGSSDDYATNGVKTHTYADGPNSWSITVDLTDEDGTFNDAADDLQVQVDNVKPAPVIDSLSGTGVTACVAGNTVTLGFSWTDPAGTNDLYDYSINWGDGSPATTASNQTSPISGAAHNYAAGTYSIVVTVNDDDAGAGNTASSSSFSFLYNTSGILQPINLTGTRSSFKIGSTIPVKLIVTDCSGASVSGLTLQVHLARVDPTAETVNEVVSSSSADTGFFMRYSSGQWIFNLSTKLSQFNVGQDLTAGTYHLWITGGSIAQVDASFDARK
jgi:hypothetical protein